MIVKIIIRLVFKFTKRIVGLPLIPERYDNYISLFYIETNETRSTTRDIQAKTSISCFPEWQLLYYKKLLSQKVSHLTMQCSSFHYGVKIYEV